ncbi:MAG TPA: formylglycine-generating enzyme family protein [Candidatus Limnocylindrales bacterium]|jgi:formylglycine-generating enzyme required for sulfatase activity|nr:formylglycine-generating enzyme family protein [Candidatus Limnocylindrales bacterium]
MVAAQPAARDVNRAVSPTQSEKSAQPDLAELTSGERIEGTLLTDHFELRTSYGDIQLKPQDTGRIDFAGPDRQLQRVTTVNSNVLTGFLTNSTIELKTSDGIRRSLRPQKLSYVRLGGYLENTSRELLQELPPEKTSSLIWVYLKNGDRLSGQLLTRSLALITAQGTELFSFEDIERIQSGPTDSTLATVSLTSGQKREGTLATEDLSFRLELGPTLKLYTGAIQLIGRELAPSPAGASSSSVAASLPTSTNLTGLVWIPPGEFVMGSPTEETGRDPDESPQTRVVIARGFWMSKCEVTQSEYQRVIGVNPSNETGDANRPVERVSWFDAMEYCKKLTQACETQGKMPEGHVYRLPTEAEWEYVCRAGAITRFGYGEDKGATQLGDYAWFSRNSDSMTHPVGTKRANAWGLFDMHGNVWEWCIDRWEDSLPGGTITNSVRVASSRLRVARGGSWLYDAKACRSANRDDYSPWDRCSDIGFRVVLAPLEP